MDVTEIVELHSLVAAPVAAIGAGGVGHHCLVELFAELAAGAGDLALLTLVVFTMAMTLLVSSLARP